MEIALVIGAALIFLLWRAFKKAAAKTAYWEAYASKLNHEEAMKAFRESCAIVAQQIANPLNSGITRKQADEHIERAVQCMSRMNELDGKDHGPVWRAKFRPQLIMQIKRTTDGLIGV